MMFSLIWSNVDMIDNEPLNYSTAVTGTNIKCWTKSIVDKIDFLNKNKTCSLTVLF